MSASLCLLTSTTLGALLGLGWWAAYSPPAWPLGPVVGVHALIGLVLWAFSHFTSKLLCSRWAALAHLRGLPAPALGLALGWGLTPAVLSPWQQAGLLGGKSGFALACAVVALGSALGIAAGAALRARRGLGLGLGLGLVALGGVGLQAGRARIPQEAQPTAQAAAGEDFAPGRVLVYGIDGADWRVLDPLLARGELPTLAGLIARGASGVLRSVEPLASPVVWTSVFTGRSPAGHGLVDWHRSDARSRTVPTLWDIWGAQGRSSLVVNVPGSWPPAEVPLGTLLAGFPIPGLTSGDKGHSLGHLVQSAEAPAGAVPRVQAQARGGRFTAEVPIAMPAMEPRLGVGNALIDALGRERVLPARGYTLALDLRPGPEGLELAGDFEGAPLRVAVGTWSPWLRVRRPGLEATLRVFVLRADAGGVELFLTPAFQAPEAPRFAWATGLPEGLDLWADGVPYIVEGLGWTAHRDPAVAALVPPMILDVQARQSQAVEQAAAAVRYDLIATVFTATDRLQHAFWHSHEPARYPAFTPPAGSAERDWVEAAYRQADAALGRLLAVLPADTLVLVVSDHGADASDGRMEEGEAGHRAEGVWIAAGPPVQATAERRELSVLDVVPTLLRCVQVPGAQDLEGRADPALCPTVPERAPVATWLGARGSGGATVVSEDQLQQIKELGYMED